MSTTRPDRAPRRRARRLGRVVTSPFRAVGRGVFVRPTQWVGRWLSGLAPRTWDLVIWVVTAVLFIIGWPTLPLTHEVPDTLLPVIAGVGVAPLLLIRAHPFLGWALWAVGGTFIPLLFPPLGEVGSELRPSPTDQSGYDFPWQVTAFLVLLALVFAVAVREPRNRVVITWLGSAVLFALGMRSDMAPGWLFGLTAIMVVGLLVRRLVLSRRELAEQTELSELERARRAIAEERTRIARDLHDVVAHRMSMVVVQAQSAQYRLGGVDPVVADEFASIADQAREALNEVRGMLGVLRSDGQLAEDVPQPGTEDVLRMLRQARAAGLDLHWEATGDPAGCGESAAMVLYRILQESLANASRHAPGARVHVDLHFGEQVLLVVRNDPSSRTPGPGRHWGNGIAGMQSRAVSVGGALTAGPTDDGGFEVRAHLPARATAAPSA